MSLLNTIYREDIDYIRNLDFPWEKMSGKTILISGANGLIASCLIDVLMEKNVREMGWKPCHVIAIGRNTERAKLRFSQCWEREDFTFISHDINLPLEIPVGTVDYILHMASNTHPVAYATDPIGTITTNIIGTKNMLDFACKHNAVRFAFASSNEIYGENRGDAEFFEEDYCGYIDCNTMRAGYPESKRCGESLCQAYRKQCGLDVVIPRFTRTYGPTMNPSDTKAISQFIKKGIAGEDIVLKSAGTQYYSFCYVADAVSGLLTILLKGEAGNAYNIADKKSDVMLKDLAGMIAEMCGTKVVFEVPDAVEKAGYSTATKARLRGEKLKTLGWEMRYDMKTGLERTLDILRR